MHRWVVLVALAACERPAPSPDAPPVTWVVPPGPGGFPLGVVMGRLGRSQPPQPLVDLGLASAAGELAPLHLATARSVPGDGPARAVVYGSEGDHPAIELVEVDRGRVVWRDVTICAAPIVGTTAEAIVCADASGTRAIGLDGKPRWATPSPFLAFTDARVVVSGAGASIILDAASGDELARVTLAPGVAVDAIIASCGDAGRELFAAGEDGRLVRIGDALGGPAISWAVPLGAIVAIDACDTASVVVTETGRRGRRWSRSRARPARSRGGSTASPGRGRRGTARIGSRSRAHLGSRAIRAIWPVIPSRPACPRSARCWPCAAIAGWCARRPRPRCCSIARACARTCRSPRWARCSATRRCWPPAGSVRQATPCTASRCRRGGSAPSGYRRSAAGSPSMPSFAVGATVRATGHDGVARWDWGTGNVDGVIAGGDVVVVHDASRIAVLDARWPGARPPRERRWRHGAGRDRPAR